MIALAVRVLAAVDPPLTPDPDTAREQLARELVKPEYNDQNILSQILDAIGRRIDGTVESTSSTPSLSWFVITVLVLALGAGLVVILSRLRRSGREKDVAEAVFTDEVVTAAELRARAHRALADGRWSDAVVDGFRALALAQVERGRVDDTPGATAHELSVAIAGSHPEQGPALARAADLFDAVRYGERDATRDQATGVLDLDSVLASARSGR